MVIGWLSCFPLHPFFMQGVAMAMQPDTPQVEVPPIPLPDQPGIGGALPNAQGPETVALSEDKVGIQGNWMKKKEWLIKSNEAFDEIQAIAFEIQGTRKTFNEKYHTIDDEFDAFYKNLSLDQGKLQELFESLERYLEKKKKKKLEELSSTNKEDVSEKDYLLKVDLLNADIKQNKEELDQLKLDLKSIDDLDKSIVERLKKVDEQLAQAKELYDKAKSSLEDLWNIIDDKKARTIYYDLKGSTSEKLKSIASYLKEDLSRDFDTVIETAKTQMKKTKESIQKLEEKGLFIKNRSQRIEQLKLKELQKLEQAKKESEHIPTQEELIDLKKIKKKPTLWYEKVYDYITTVSSKVYSFVKEFFGLGTQKKSSVKSAPKSKPVQTTASTTTPTPQIPASIPTAIPTAAGTSATSSQGVAPATNAIAQIPVLPPPASTSQPEAAKAQQPLSIPLPAPTGGGMPLN